MFQVATIHYKKITKIIILRLNFSNFIHILASNEQKKNNTRIDH